MGSEIDLAIESILSKDVDLNSASDLGPISKNSTFDDVVMGFHDRHQRTSLEHDQDFPFFHHNSQNICRSIDFQHQNTQSHKFLFSDNAVKNSAAFLSLSGNSSDCESNFMTSSSQMTSASLDSTTSNIVAAQTQFFSPLFNSTSAEGSGVTVADDFFATDICSQTYPLLSSAAITLGDDSPVKNAQAHAAANLQRRPLPPAAPPAKNAGQQMDSSLVDFINLNFIEEAILEVVFDVHRWAKCGLMFLLNKSVDKNLDKSNKYKIKCVGFGADIFDESSNAPSTSSATTGGPNGTVKPPKFTQQADCVCPECGQPTAACRFAPHLEKCMGMGRNSSRVARRRLAAVCSSSSLSSLAKGNKNADNPHQQQQQHMATRSSIHISNSSSKLKSMPKGTTTKRTRAKIWIEDEGEDDEAEESDGIFKNLISNDNNHGSLNGEDSNSSTAQPRGGTYEDDDDWSNTSGGGVNSRKKNRQKKNFAPKTSRRKLKVDVDVTGFKSKQACLSEERSNEDASLLSDFLGCTQYSQRSSSNDLSVNTHYLGQHDLSELQDVPSPSL